MTTLEVSLVVVGALLLAMLALAVVVLIHEVAVLRVRVDQAAQTFGMAEGWLGVGDLIPAEAIERSPSLSEGVQFILAASSSCSPCRSLIGELADIRLPAPVNILMAGPKEEAEKLVSVLHDGGLVVFDPDAQAMTRALKVHSTPWAMAVVEGRLDGAAGLASADDLRRLMTLTLESLPVTVQTGS